MNDGFFRAYAEYFIGALVICLLAALLIFCVIDGTRRVAHGAFYLGLIQTLASVSVGVAAAWSWYATAGLIDDTTPRREASTSDDGDRT